MSERVQHGLLKNWLIEEAKAKITSKGKPYYKRVYSGDSEPVSIPSKGKQFEYRPDIVLIEKSRMFLISIGLSYDWRTIVGELALANAADAFMILFILFDAKDGRSEEIERIVSVVGKTIHYHGAVIVLTREEYDDLERAKDRLRKDLYEWI